MTPTDLEKLKVLLDSWDVEYEEYKRNGMRCIILIEGKNKVTGYAGFVTEFDFTDHGEFIEVGAWD